ncbi:hypothetical protein AVEN_76386-1 [Araneus ventricosus]|uniref:Uncharacterized protein n=1 Tax=Araneus ventricosus TaxID=182803 RepID=A0A4Y1ZR68_ARAVE|nr:hypothetical protein AVEN_76386-1 [Araneus ventricosus]
MGAMIRAKQPPLQAAHTQTSPEEGALRHRRWNHSSVTSTIIVSPGEEKACILNRATSHPHIFEVPPLGERETISDNQ